MRTINKEGFELIKSFESLRLEPYKDIAGIPTIGWGTTKYSDGSKVTLKDTPISKDKADYELLFSLNQFCNIIDKFLTLNQISISDNAFSALVSLAYNAGTGAVIKSGNSLPGALKNRDAAAITNAFLAYDKATIGGKKIKVEGLARRRRAEVDLFFKLS